MACWKFFRIEKTTSRTLPLFSTTIYANYPPSSSVFRTILTTIVSNRQFSLHSVCTGVVLLVIERDMCSQSVPLYLAQKKKANKQKKSKHEEMTHNEWRHRLHSLHESFKVIQVYKLLIYRAYYEYVLTIPNRFKEFKCLCTVKKHVTLYNDFLPLLSTECQQCHKEMYTPE